MSDTNESPTATASRPDNPVKPSHQADRTGEGRVNANKINEPRRVRVIDAM